MSKRRIQPAASPSSISESVTTPPTTVPKSFLGLSLGGGKTDKACIAVLDYYEAQDRLFLGKIHEKIKNEEQLSGDLKVHELVKQYEPRIEYIAVDVPWRLPSCLRCHLICPGYENCREPHIQWMWEYYYDHRAKKRPQKIFTPYTQRCVEFYLQSEIEEKFVLSHAMGANSAPVLARAAFVLRRLQLPVIEAHPRVTLWRLGEELKIMKSHLRGYRHASYGEQARRSILHSFSRANLFFMYELDKKMLIENHHAFESLMLALTAFFKYKNKTEPKPANFPAYEDWIEFPVKNPLS